MCGFLGIEKSNMFQEIHLEKFVQQMQWYLKRKTIIKKKTKNLKASYKERFKISLVTQERQRKIWDSKKNSTPDPLTRQAIPSVSGTSRGRVTRRGGGGKESLEQEQKLIWCDKKTLCFFLHQSLTPPINNCWISRLIFICYFIKISSNIYSLIQQTLG